MSTKVALLKQEIHHTLEVFRYLFADSTIIRSIDDIYEEELMRKVDLIPEAAADKVCKGIDVFIAFFKAINFKDLTSNLSSLPFPVNPKVDVYKLTLRGVDDKNKIKNSTIRSAVVVIIKQCKPILDCFTLALSDPVKYMILLGETDMSDYDHIL